MFLVNTTIFYITSFLHTKVNNLLVPFDIHLYSSDNNITRTVKMKPCNVNILKELLEKCPNEIISSLLITNLRLKSWFTRDEEDLIFAHPTPKGKLLVSFLKITNKFTKW